MCGIAGFITGEPIEEFISDCAGSLRHRGPDEIGYYYNDNVCILNTRLSIIDVAHGQQPFASKDSKIQVVQNGEIYNFVEIKDELIKKGYQFSTDSDTEVILKAYECYGTSCFEYFNGMFAIAIYDAYKQKLFLGRDRLGVKPLYFYQKDNMFLFSSEIKTFLKYPHFDKTIAKQEIHNFLKFNYVPLPNTIFKHVKHIEPAHFYTIDVDTLAIEKTVYWQIENNSETELAEGKVLERLDDLMNDAIRIRLRSDVEIGAFLSGGLDSSLVCAMTKQNFNHSLETFSIGFYEKQFDESTYAKTVAQLNNLQNNVTFLESNIVSLWSKITWHNDQPHGDISFIPTYLLSEFAAKKYKLVFTGDGGDEAFAGYEKYYSILTSNLPQSFDDISLIKDDALFDSLYTNDFKQSVDYTIPQKIFFDTVDQVSHKDDINKMLYFDTKQLLPGNNLVKPDKMGMANSLEARSPMLDHRLFEFMQTLPGAYKLQEGETKYILKKFALKYLPEDIVYRKKQMFTVPVGEWFKEHLKEYLISIIQSESLQARNIFNHWYIEHMVDAHISGQKDYTRELRAIVNLELWFREFIDSTFGGVNLHLQ